MTRTLLILAALYVVLRCLVVLALGDVFFYGEELEKGAIASALLQGVDVPYARLPYHPYEGGGFVASHLKALMFLVVGPNILAHKLAALLWGLLVLWVTVALAWRHAGRGAAWLAGLLLVLAPAHIQKQSLLHVGIHYESLLFIALVLDLGLRVAATPVGERPRTRLLVGLGLAAGFGTYFSYQVPAAVLAVIVLLARTDWRRIFAPPLIIATLAGLVPLALMALAVGGEIVDIHGANVGEGGGWSRLVHALQVGTRSTLSRATVGLGAVAFVAGVWSVPLRDDRRRAVFLFAGFGALWVALAAATGMILAVRDDPHWLAFIRFAPFVYTLLVLIALAAGPALERALSSARRGPAIVTACAVLGLLVVGGINALGLVREGQIGAARENLALLVRTNGIEIRGALIKLGPRLEDSDDPDVARRGAASIAPFAGLDDARPGFVAAELAAVAAQRVGGVTPDEMLTALMTATDGRFERADLALGIGAVVLRSISDNVHGALSDPAFDPVLAEALGRAGHGFLALEAHMARDFADPAGTPHEERYLRGLGYRVLRCSVMQPYWGPALRLHPDLARLRLAEVARAAGIGDDGVVALLDGFDEAARDFGLIATTLPE